MSRRCRGMEYLGNNSAFQAPALIINIEKIAATRFSIVFSNFLAISLHAD
jgi:hypothetical protein